MKSLVEGNYNIPTIETVSESALSEIFETLSDHLDTVDNSIDISALENYILGEERDATWVTNRGTWPKRLVKWIKNNFNHKLNNDIASQVGIIARKAVVFSTFRELVIDRVDWDRGTFGVDESDSCYWGCREAAKYFIWNSGGYSLKIFNHGDPEGRAWVVPVPEGWVVFNSYSVSSSDIECTTFARILCNIFDWPYYRRVRVRNNGKSNGLIWINGRDNEPYGFLICGTENSDVNTIDLNISTPCVECGTDLWDDNEDSSVDYNRELIPVHKRCNPEYCDSCGSPFSPSNAEHMLTTVCPGSPQNDYWQTQLTLQRERWCISCLEGTSLSICRHCGISGFSTGPHQSIVNWNGHKWCIFCITAFAHPCDVCGSIVAIRNIIYLDSSFRVSEENDDGYQPIVPRGTHICRDCMEYSETEAMYHSRLLQRRGRWYQS